MIRVLDAGVDTLYWSASPAVGPWFESASAAKAEAITAKGPVPWRTIRGFEFEVLPHGMGKYAVVARCAEMDVRLSSEQHIPTVYVQLRASFIHAAGIAAAARESVEVAREIVGGELGRVRPSRVDVFADFGGLSLRDEDRAGFHTRADVAAFFRPGTSGYTSIRAGMGRFKVRAYDKRLERKKRGAPVPLAWGDYAGDVMRVEVQADERSLRLFGIETLEDVVASYGDLWRYGTRRFFVLRVPGVGPMRDWPVDQRWRVVQDAELRFPANGLLPLHEAKGDKVRVLRLVRGCLVTLGAHLGVDDLGRVIDALPRELETVADGRSYPEDVRRRFKRFPRAVRERIRR